MTVIANPYIYSFGAFSANRPGAFVDSPFVCGPLFGFGAASNGSYSYPPLFSFGSPNNIYRFNGGNTASGGSLTLPGLNFYSSGAGSYSGSPLFSSGKTDNIYHYNGGDITTSGSSLFNLPKLNFYSSAKTTSASKTTSVRGKSFGTVTRPTGNGKTYGDAVLNSALSYLGYNESDKSYLKFTNGREEAWCADFVTYTMKEAAKKTGKKAPISGSASVAQLRQQAIANGCYIKTSGKSNKAEIITAQVKPGDAVIFKEGGRSHTGIVKSVDSNGNFTTVEGNTKNDNVGERTYSCNESTLSGFIKLS